MRKKEYHHGNLKEDFLQIAFDFIEKEGIEKLTLKVLSDATGTSRSAIYKHFSSKDVLIEQIIIRGFDKFDESTAPLLKDKSVSLIDRFYLSGHNYFTFAKNHSNLYRLLFGHKYASLREEVISINDEDCSGFGALKQAIEEGQKNGLLKKEDALMRTVLLWSSLHGLASLMIDGFMDVDKMEDELYEMMFQDMINASLAGKMKFLKALPFAEKLMTPKSKS